MITPSIDPFCAKNEPLTPSAAQAILQYVGLLGGDGDSSVATFCRRDGSPGRVDRRVDILQTGPPPPPETPLVVQLSRWDRIKDMQGFLQAFAEHVDRTFDAHLMLVGPAVHGVSDVVEAMWKYPPVVASRVGGIVDQIVDGEHGLLIDDPRDLAAFGTAINQLLGDSTLGGTDGRQRLRAGSPRVPRGQPPRALRRPVRLVAVGGLRTMTHQKMTPH